MASSYRSGLDGLVEQLRALEEEKRRLEADLTGVRRIRFPQRALRVALGLLVVGAAGLSGGALGYRRAVVQLADISRQDARTALRRIELCHERLRGVLAAKVYRTDEQADEALAEPSE